MRRGARGLSTGQWAGMALLVFIVGLAFHLALITVLAGIVLVLVGLAWLWYRAILVDVAYKREFGHTHIFPGEQTEITWTLENNKPLPISWLRWQEEIESHPYFTTDTGITVNDGEIDVLENDAAGVDEITSIRGFETMVKTATVTGVKRGYYRFGPTVWSASDAVGLFTATSQVNDGSGLVVYPRLMEAEEFDLPVRALLGDIRQRSALLEDPTWYRGPREYRPGDPMRHMDWKATARTSSLMVKTFEPTVHPKLMVVANLHSFERVTDGIVTAHIENVISAAASISKWALDEGFEVGLHSNGAMRDTEVPFRIPPAAGDEQVLVILDYLARIVLLISRRIEDLLEASMAGLPFGTTVVVCSSIVNPGLVNALAALARKAAVVLVLIDGAADVSIPRVTVTRLKSSAQGAQAA